MTSREHTPLPLEYLETHEPLAKRRRTGESGTNLDQSWFVEVTSIPSLEPSVGMRDVADPNRSRRLLSQTQLSWPCLSEVLARMPTIAGPELTSILQPPTTTELQAVPALSPTPGMTASPESPVQRAQVPESVPAFLIHQSEAAGLPGAVSVAIPPNEQVSEFIREVTIGGSDPWIERVEDFVEAWLSFHKYCESQSYARMSLQNKKTMVDALKVAELLCHPQTNKKPPQREQTKKFLKAACESNPAFSKCLLDAHAVAHGAKNGRTVKTHLGLYSYLKTLRNNRARSSNNQCENASGAPDPLLPENN